MLNSAQKHKVDMQALETMQHMNGWQDCSIVVYLSNK
jgi:hypothetical protein